MDDAIGRLLDVLAAVEDAGIYLTDTDIRERLFSVVYHGFIHQEPGYGVPTDQLDDCGDDEELKTQVRVALANFLTEARQSAAHLGLNTPEQRQAVFLGSEATSASGVDVGEYFD